MKGPMFALAVPFAAMPPVAQAERADRDKPLNYEANSGECDDLKQVCVLVGDVLLVKGTMRSTGERESESRAWMVWSSAMMRRSSAARGSLRMASRSCLTCFCRSSVAGSAA